MNRTIKSEMIVVSGLAAAAGIEVDKAIPLLTQSSPAVTSAIHTLLRSDAIIGSIAYSAAAIVAGCILLKSLIRNDSKSQPKHEAHRSSSS